MKPSPNRTGKSARRPLTRAMLLPLPASMVRTTSLQNHLALEALRCGQGNSMHVSFLFRVLYPTYLLRDTVSECCAIEVLREAEAALHRCTAHAASCKEWRLPQPDISTLQVVLTVHDRQLACVPAHIHKNACEQVLQFARSDRVSLLPTAGTDN